MTTKSVDKERHRLTNEEIERRRTLLWARALGGDAEARWLYAKNFILHYPKCTYKQFRTGLALLKQAANQGVLFAQGELAYHLYYGYGCDKDEKSALRYCDMALSSFIQQPQWLRLRQVITGTPNLLLSHAQLDLYHAFIHHDVSYIEPRLADDVILCDLLRHPTPGKMDVMEWLTERVSKEGNRASLVPTERYGMVTEVYVPNDIHSVMRSIFFVRTNQDNKIDRIARQPLVWDDYCFSAGSKPFSWDEIEPCIDDEYQGKGSKMGHMFCMECGKLSHDLKWIHFHSAPDPETGFSYHGRMSVCPDCKKQVWFNCENAE